MKSYLALIEDLLEGHTPKQKYEYLQSLISENARAKGRIDFCKNQFTILANDESTHKFQVSLIESVIKTLETPI